MSVDTPIWQVLRSRAAVCEQTLNLQQVLNSSGRFERLSLQAPHVLLDCSKSLWDEAVLEALLQLAEEAGLAQRREAMYAGAVVNETEQRPALHVRLRAPLAPQGCSVPEDECHVGLRAMLTLAQQLREQARFTDVVHIGIGGSGLGPELALQALRPWCDGGPRVHVVSNMDGHDLHQALQGLEPERTLFIVASKSWSTAETQRNMASAKAWIGATGELHWPDHFVAVSSREDLARQSGFTQTLHIPQGIGGRFSIWSAVGLPVALAVGPEVFERLLAGAAEMDMHFAQAPLERNAPVWLGLLDVWYASLLRMPGRCVAPYHHGLRRLPAYLQQLEMESNGKQVRADGTAVGYPTTGMVWGEPGSNGQHAFFQWLHQGTQRIPVEFIAARTAAHDLPEHQEALLANALAQAQALMQGSKAGPGQLPGHQDFPGNRPSTFMLLDALTPESLGALLALHEHRVFVAGTVWGINSFDQWGVELGKTLAKDLRARMDSGDLSGLDASTSGLLAYCRSETESV
ncbi:Glucose-6-phosphate isomerase [Comamonas testosteroni KF-1]|uniref:Glucose-6-phosphate isomerase n=1 Tax=Comamonas testosteroni (strain DSM 14576 / KF-1) TaxID=399795 RepID=B7X5D5_COMTK|nr:Glucose-6-phosphate isomerase [Comamonas testosteroni KF-1]